MFTALTNTIMSNEGLRQLVNWWLGYTLSQPVDIDLASVLYFAQQYFGITKLSETHLHLEVMQVMEESANFVETSMS